MTVRLLRERPAGGSRDGTQIPGHRFNGDGAIPPGGLPQATTGIVGVAAFLAAVTMLFIAFTTAYLARRQEAGWPAIGIPAILWVNTAVLLASSATLERARALLRRGDIGFRPALAATAALGAAFVLGQLVAWRQLAAQGMFLASNPHSSFFYLLTGAHGLHLLGGLGALSVVLARAWRGQYTPRAHAGITVFATYWHFMAGLWLYLFVLLLVG